MRKTSIVALRWRLMAYLRGNPWMDEIMAASYDIRFVFTEDISMYLRYASRTGGPVLEAGCGTGRVLIPLAQAGYGVTGIDSSPHMLARLHSKLQEEPSEVRQRVVLLEADLRDFGACGLHRLAIITVNTFLMCLDRDGQEAALTSIYEALAPEGTLIVDLTLPEPSDEKGAPPLYPLGDRGRGLYPIITPDGVVQPGAIPHVSPGEMVKLFEEKRFQVIDCFSGYNGEPFLGHSGKMIVVAKRG